MKALLDTSVLVAAHLPTHPFYSAAIPWIAHAKLGTYELVVSAHSLAETYSVLTRLPVKPRIIPAAAWQFIEQNIVSCAVIVALNAGDYQVVMKHVVHLGLMGGVVPDAVIAKAGDLAAVDYLMTFNVAHFQKVWPSAAMRVFSPQAMAPP
jgi:predicted nucleic acid-binding protein